MALYIEEGPDAPDDFKLSCDDCWYSCATLTCDDSRASDVCDCGAQEIQDALAALAVPVPEEETRP